jgi:hypothetical protein
MAVERTRWTDDRLDQLAERVMRQDVIEMRFDNLEGRFDRLERRFDRLEDQLSGFQTEMGSLRSEVYASKRWMIGLFLSVGLGFTALLIQVSLNS